MAPPQSAGARIGRAIVVAWGYALGLALIAGAVRLLFGPSKAHPIPAGTVVSLYFIAATIVGFLAGCLQPFATTAWRAWLVGLIAGWPGIYVFYSAVMHGGIERPDIVDLVAVTLMTAVYAHAISRDVRRH